MTAIGDQPVRARSASCEPARLVRRAVKTLREGGIRALLWQALATAGVRRLEIHCRPAEREPAEAVKGVTIRPLSSGDAAAYRALRPAPEITEAEFRRRLQADERCFGAWRPDQLIAIHWLALEEARVSYLGISFALAPDVCYDHEAFTAPHERRRGIGNMLGAAARADARSEGKSKVLSAILPENRAGAGFIAPWSHKVGTLASVRLGPWRLARAVISPGYIEPLRLLQRSMDS